MHLDEIILNQAFSIFNRVPGGPLQEVISHDPHVEGARVLLVSPQTTDEGVALANGVQWLRVDLVSRVILQNHTRSPLQSFPQLVHGHARVIDREVDRFPMGNRHRNPDTGSGDLDVLGVHIAQHDLLGLVDHLPFLMGVAVVLKDIDLRQEVEGQRIVLLDRKSVV